MHERNHARMQELLIRRKAGTITTGEERMLIALMERYAPTQSRPKKPVKPTAKYSLARPNYQFPKQSEGWTWNADNLSTAAFAVIGLSAFAVGKSFARLWRGMEDMLDSRHYPAYRSERARKERWGSSSRRRNIRRLY